MVTCIFIQNISYKGGTERMAVSLANELVDRGHAVSIVSLEPALHSFFLLREGVKLYSLNIASSKLKWRYFSAVKRLRAILKNIQADVVIDVDTMLSLVSLSAVKPLKTKVISWEHYNYFTKSESKARVWGRKCAAKKAYAVVTLTEEDAGYFAQNCRCNAKIVAIPNFMVQLPEQPSPLSENIVLAIGHLTHRKGFDMLIKAWALAKKEDTLSWKLHIVGDGEEKQNLQSQARNLGLENEIVFLPPTDDIASHYFSASIFVMSSRAEGLPMVLIEAKSYGLPIVSFACCTGPADIVKDGVDGFLVEPEDIVSLKGKLLTVMNSKDLMVSMSINARADAERFLPKAVMGKWENLLSGIM